MIWLWGIPPILIVVGALWLAMGTRRLIQSRLEVVDDLEGALTDVRDQTNRLQESLDALGDGQDAEPGTGDGDR